MSETIRTMVPVILIGLGACWFLVSAVMLVRQRRKDRLSQQQWQHESRVQQRIAELLQQEYEQLLTPEERQRREAQRQHLQQLRAQAVWALMLGMAAPWVIIVPVWLLIEHDRDRKASREAQARLQA